MKSSNELKVTEGASSLIKPVLYIGAALLLGFAIYKARKDDDRPDFLNKRPKKRPKVLDDKLSSKVHPRKKSLAMKPGSGHFDDG